MERDPSVITELSTSKTPSGNMERGSAEPPKHSAKLTQLRRVLITFPTVQRQPANLNCVLRPHDTLNEEHAARNKFCRTTSAPRENTLSLACPNTGQSFPCAVRSNTDSESSRSHFLQTRRVNVLFSSQQVLTEISAHFAMEVNGCARSGKGLGPSRSLGSTQAGARQRK